MVRNEEPDRPPWLQMPSDEDDSPMAQFRREILELAREVEAEHRPATPSPGGLTFGAPPTPPENLDVRATTPFLIVRARRTLRHRLEAETSMRDGRALVLLEIGRSDGSAPRNIARSLGIRMTSLSRVVKRAERDGLVRRRLHHYDARTCLLELTPEGRRTAVSAAAVVREADRALLRGLSADERDELRRLLRRAAAALAGPDRNA